MEKSLKLVSDEQQALLKWKPEIKVVVSKGAPMNAKLPQFYPEASNFGEASRMHYVVTSLPPINFRRFNGSNPRIWRRQCENFFSLYNVPDDIWVKMGVMHFDGSTLYWLQSAEERLLTMSCGELCEASIGRFGRDHHSHLIHQFFPYPHKWLGS